MPRDTAPITTDERGAEQHPAWGLIGVSRVSTSPPGAVLFDSDIRHQHTVVLRVSPAKRNRDLHRDWHFTVRAPIIEVEMSEAQWASCVSSMNAGDGVPCTVRRTQQGDVPGVPYEPRLAGTMNEVGTKSADAIREVQAAFEAYRAHSTKANLRTLEYAIKNLPANMQFAAKSLVEHTENVVQRARADVEAMVLQAASQHGLEPGDIGVTLQLDSGGGE